MRSLYQGALLGWLKEQSKDALLDPMQQVCRKLYTRLGRNELRRLWWIAERAMQGLRDGAIDNDLPLRRLYARLDLTLKAMVEGGEYGPSSDTITALSRALLFYAAQARPGSKATDALRERFRLEELIPDRDALMRARGAVTGRDAGLFRSIGEAVREELGQVKDTLDMELRTGRVDAEQRSASRNSLRQLADTLHMLNLPVPAKAVAELLPALEQAGESINTDLDSPLLALAQQLLEVESILDTHIQLLGEPVEEQPSRGFIALPAHEQRLILSAMLDECVSSLHEVQEAIRKRAGGGCPGRLRWRPATDRGRAQRRLARRGRGPDGETRTSLQRRARQRRRSSGQSAQPRFLTDAVAALELYLAGCRDEQGDSLRFLQVMHDRLEGLPEASAAGEEVPATVIKLPPKPAPAQTRLPAPAQTKVPAAAHAPAAPKTRASKSSMDIDPAMLGIFLEEFDSVRTQLEERLPRWLEDRGDGRALADIRRGFHTLKGSGRMVGAMEVGDFAWSIEDLLNRLLEEKISFSDSLGEAVRLAVAALGGLRARMLAKRAHWTLPRSTPSRPLPNNWAAARNRSSTACARLCPTGC